MVFAEIIFILLRLEGVRDKETSYSLVHPTAYYTLNNIPEGTKLSLTEVSTKNSAATASANNGFCVKTTAPKTSRQKQQRQNLP